MIVTTDAVVLRSLKYGDTSRIVTLYTRRFGKLSVIAKGARGRRNKFGAALEPMSHLSAVIYRKERRELHLLSQGDLVEGFRGIAESLERMAAAMTAIELVNAVAHDEEANDPLFLLVLDTLAALDSATMNTGSALYYFEIRLAEILGFRPELGTCLSCGAPLGEEGQMPAGMQLQSGGVLCGSCARTSPTLRPLSAPAAAALQRLQALSSAGGALRITLNAGVRREIGSVLRAYLQYHVEGLKDSRAEKVFSSLL